MPRCYTRVVPTIRPRHVITETADIARALDDAAKRWPEDSHDRRRLLLRLVAEGHRMALDQGEVHAAERRAAVLRTSGTLTGVYGEHYLSGLREDWPE
jgi:glutathione S-transferase